MFALDPAITASCIPLCALSLCEARLQADARWPWIVLIPRGEGLREFEDLTGDARTLLIEEIVLAGAAVRSIGVALGRPIEKLNVGALGNITPQLHIHVVGRRADDPAWPGPVWGSGAPSAPAAGWLEAARAAAVAVLGSGESL